MIASGVQVTSTVNLGAIIIIAVVLALGGLFTLRTKLGSYWKQAYEEQLARADAARDENRDLRSELAAERMKTDLTAVLRQTTDQHAELLKAMVKGSVESVDEVKRSLADAEARNAERHAEILERHAEILGALREVRTSLQNGNGHE